MSVLSAQTAQQRPARTLLHSGALVTGLTVLTTGMSFAVQILIAKLFGFSGELDAYFTGTAIPLMLSGIMLSGIGYVLLPSMARHPSPAEIAGENTLPLLVLLGLVALSGMVCAPWLVHYTAPGLAAWKLRLAAHIQVFYWVGMALSVVSAVFNTCHHLCDSFLVPALSLLVNPVVIILSALLLSHRLGVLSLGLGYALGCCAQLLILQKSPVRPRWTWANLRLTPACRAYLSDVFLMALTLAPYTIVTVIDAYWASRLTSGSLSCVSYGFRMAGVGGNIAVTGIATVLFPSLSREAGAGDSRLLRKIVKWTLLICILVLPLVWGLTMLLRFPLIRLLFQHGRFTAFDTARLANVLPWYAVGMVAMAGTNVLGRGLFAHKRFQFSASAGIGFVVLYFLMDAILLPTFGYKSFGVSYSIAWISLFLVSFIYLRRLLRHARKIALPYGV